MNQKPDNPAIQKNIDQEEGQRLLKQGAESLGVKLSSLQVDQFLEYLSLLSRWNRHINLTGLRSPGEIIVKHFLDSLTPLPYIPEMARLLDFGSGAGFPGLPIKIVRPHQIITLIEASSKKVSFLKEAVRSLHLGLIPIYQAYLGEKAAPFWETDHFDMVITRAVGKILKFLAASAYFLKPGGKVLFMKGPKGPEEMLALKPQIQEKGFRLEPPVVLTLPFLEQPRTLIFATKTGTGHPKH